MTPRALPLSARVEEVRSHIRRRWIYAGAIWIAAVLTLLWLSVWLAMGPRGWRPGSPWPLTLDLMALSAILVGTWGVRVIAKARLGEARVAGVMERVANLSNGELRGPLELSRDLPAGVSGSLANHAAEHAAKALGGRGARDLAGDLGQEADRWLGRGRTALGAGALILLALTIYDRGRATEILRGVANPLSIRFAEGLTRLAVEPGDAEVSRGRRVRINVQADGRRLVELAWQADGDIGRVERIEVVDGVATFLLPPLTERTEYRVRGDVGPESPSYTLVPVDPLFLSEFSATAEFPPHTDLPDQNFRGGIPPLRIPEGTVLAFEGRANRALASVHLTDSTEAVASALEPAGAAFSGRWTPVRDGRYHWGLTGVDGSEPEPAPQPIQVELVPDLEPSLRVTEPGRDTVLSLDLRQALRIQAGDDYGLGTLELVGYRITAIGEEREPVVRRIDLNGARDVVIEPTLDVADWGLLPDDRVRYFARVTDNAPLPHVVTTPEFTLRMPSSSELQRATEAALEEAAERLAELAEGAQSQADENRERARERTLTSPARGQTGTTRSPNESGFSEREEFQQAVEEQRNAGAAVDSLSAELSELERRLEGAGQADAELRAQMRELQELLQDLEGSELGAEVDRLEEALDRGDTNEATRALEDLAAEQERFRERLEESLERFRRAAVDQDFRATRNEADELARMERALADAVREDPNDGSRVEQQNALVERNRELEERLARLEERLGEIGEEEAASGVRAAAEQVDQAGSQMRQAAEAAQRGAAEEAAQQADAAAREMDEASEALSEAQNAMQNERMDAIREALERTAEDALTLARRQDELRTQMRSAGRDGLAGLRVDEASLSRGVENLAENLRIATEGRVPGAREIAGQIGEVLESVDRTVESMGSLRSSAGSPMQESERVVGALNQLALIALKNAEQMGQGGQGQEQQGQQMQEALQELAQQQGDLVNQAGQIMPMQLGQQALSEQLQQLSDGQQAISDQLGDLSGQPSSDQALGDLEEMAVEAAELARELAEGRLSPEAARRQERLFHRLLDAGRSLEREEFSEERESEEAGAFEPGTVSPLDDAALGRPLFQWPDAEQMRSLSPGVRELIRAYFERLNRGGAPVGGGQ